MYHRGTQIPKIGKRFGKMEKQALVFHLAKYLPRLAV